MGISKRVEHIHVSQQPIPNDTKKLPWPRFADDNKTQLGVNVVEKEQDIIKIVYKFFKVSDIPMEELMQEVFLTIIHKNHSRSAHDPRKSSFGHYVYMIANNVCINLVHRKERFDKEKESLDAPYRPGDYKTLLDTIELPEEEPDVEFDERCEELEFLMRQMGKWDLARYITAVRSGANLDVIRDALTWGGRKITNKNIRDWRTQIRDITTDINSLDEILI